MVAGRHRCDSDGRSIHATPRVDVSAMMLRQHRVGRCLKRAWLAASLCWLLAGCAPGAGTEASLMRAYEMSLAVSSAGQYVAWHGGLGDGSSIYIQKVGRDDQLIGQAFRVSDGRRLAYEPDLLLADDQLVVAWYEKDAATGRLTAMMAGIDEAGRLLWRVPVTDATARTKNPVVRQIGQHLHVAWIQQVAVDEEGGGDKEGGTTIWHRRFSLDGVPETPPRQIGQASANTWNLNATVYGTSLIVTYDAAKGAAAHELQMLVVTDKAVRHSQLTPNDGYASLYPDLQVNAAGQAALTWFDEKDGNREVYLLVVPFDVLGTAQMPPPRRITDDKGESIGAYVAWNGPTIGLAWSDEVRGSREIFFATFSDEGHPLGPVRQIGSSEGKASIPSIRASGSGFFIAWNDYIAATGNGHGPVASSAARLQQVSGAP